MKTELKKFDSMDWNAWAGAENFADGSSPLIADISVANWTTEDECRPEDWDGSATLIVDGRGLAIYPSYIFENGGTWLTYNAYGTKGITSLPSKIIPKSSPVNIKTLLKQGWFFEE